MGVMARGNRWFGAGVRCMSLQWQGDLKCQQAGQQVQAHQTSWCQHGAVCLMGARGLAGCRILYEGVRVRVCVCVCVCTCTCVCACF